MEAAAMLTILLPMRMVESSLSYFSDMASTRAADVSPSSARLFRRIWFREENAVSEAEKKGGECHQDHQRHQERNTAIVHNKGKSHSTFCLIFSGPNGHAADDGQFPRRWRENCFQAADTKNVLPTVTVSR